MSYADDQTEKSLKELENKIKREYNTARKNMNATYKGYISGYDEDVGGKTIHHKGILEREEDLIKALESGEVEVDTKKGETIESYLKKWRTAQIGRGKNYKAMLDQLTNEISNANQMASSYINDKTPSIYSLNANYQAYEIGHGLEGVSFTMYDEQTVKNLITDAGNYTEFKTVSVNPKRDYQWNSKEIKSAVISGILQGKSIAKLTDSFEQVMKRNRASAIRNARTAYTSAQNGGRMTSLKQAKAQGINVKKQWLATSDERTRFSHALLNGQIRDIEKRFGNGLMYPGDSDGAPAEVYNCRCTLTYIYPKYDNDVSNEIYADNKLEGESFNAFMNRMKEVNNNASEDRKG